MSVLTTTAAAAFAAGFLTGLAIYQAPRLVAPLFQDEPQTPPGHQTRSRYWNGGVEVAATTPDTAWPLRYRTATPTTKEAPQP